MRTTLNLEPDVLRAAKHIARRERKSLGEVVSELARRGLALSATKRYRNAFPVFDVRQDAPAITPRTVVDALDE